MDEITELIKAQGMLEVDIENMAEMSKNDKLAFLLNRRNGFGGSDSSVLLNVNPFKTQETLVAEKLATAPTKEELEVGNKVNVRKGADLEPLVLSKFEEWAELQPGEVHKPNPSYKFTQHPHLKVNYDGVLSLGDKLVPVEAKFVSTFATKYWTMSKSIDKLWLGDMHVETDVSETKRITAQAKAYGIPVYYYTQLQQEIIGLNAPFGYLAALFDKDWTLRVFKVFRDSELEKDLYEVGDQLWNNIESIRKRRL